MPMLIALLAGTAEPPPRNANEANLAAMQAVAAAAPMTPADGAIEAAAVQRWRDDKAKDLRRESATGGQGGAPQP